MLVYPTNAIKQQLLDITNNGEIQNHLLVVTIVIFRFTSRAMNLHLKE